MLFQYESAHDAFDTKIRHLMSSLQVQYTSHARILTRHYQYQHSLNQDIFSISQYALNQSKEPYQPHQPHPYTSCYIIVLLNDSTI